MSTIDCSQIALLSYFTADFQPIHDLNGPVKQKYCDKWGYKHIVQTHAKEDSRYYAFARLGYIRNLFLADKRLKAILVMNGHAQIMNHTIPIQSCMDEEHDFFIAKNCNGKLINAGVFIIKNSDWSIRWLDHILSYGDKHHSYSEKEQNIIIENENHPDFKDKIKILPMKQLQCHLWQHYNWDVSTTDGQFEKGDWILHIPGRSVFADSGDSLLKSRIKLFSSKEIADNIIY